MVTRREIASLKVVDFNFTGRESFGYGHEHEIQTGLAPAALLRADETRCALADSYWWANSHTAVRVCTTKR